MIPNSSSAGAHIGGKSYSLARPLRFLVLPFLGLVLSITIALAAAPAVDPNEDPQMEKMLWEARDLLRAKDAAGAIAKCDQVIKAFQSYYGGRKEKVYCARSSAETVAVLLKATGQQESAIALGGTWAGAYFIKAYAFQDAHRIPEAKAALLLALKLSPFDSHYLNELGEIYALEKNWPDALKTYREAEENVKIGPEEGQADNLARARRGQGYVLVELGKLEEAEKKYQQCLATNPDDTKAKAELGFVREQMAKRKAR